VLSLKAAHLKRYKDVGLLLFDNGSDHRKTAGAVFRKHVPMNVVCVHEDDVSLRRRRERKNGEE